MIYLIYAFYFCAGEENTFEKDFEDLMHES